MKKTLGAGLAALLFSAGVFTGRGSERGLTIPQGQRGPAPAFRAGTTLVEFSLVALDGGGHPVTDLEKDDLVVSEQGQLRDVAFFRFDGAAGKRDTEPLPPGVFTNRSEYTAGPPRNVTAIVLDAINTRLSDQIEVRRQLLRYLDTLAPDTRVAVYQIGWRMTVVHDFTDDLASLRARMAKYAMEPVAQASVDLDEMASGDSAAVEQASALSPDFGGSLQQALADMRSLEANYVESVDNRKRYLTLASLEALGTHLAGIPGRKSLVWIGNGMPILTATARFVEIHERLFRQTAQRLASEGVTVYPVDALGLLPPPSGISSIGRGSAKGAPPAPRPLAGLPDQRAWATLDLMAEVTGGRVSRNTNDLAEGVKAAANDLRGAYTVGFYAVGPPDSRWHQLDVKVKRRGVKVSHRQGYLSEAPATQPVVWSDAQWRRAIANPLASTIVHLDARFDPVVPVAKDGGGTYDLLLLISPDDFHFRRTGDRMAADVEIVVAEKDPGGNFTFRVGATKLALPEGTETAGSVVRYRDRLKLGPDTSIIRLIVRDRFTGRYGTLDVPVKQIPK